MNKLKSLLRLVLVVFIVSTPFAVVYAGTGSLRIDPFWPTMVGSPADFDIWAETGVAMTPHIFLVMTESCYNGLTGDTIVSWTGASSPLIIDELDWIGPFDTGDPDIPPGATTGASYTVASLKSHLGTSEPVYYVFEPFLEGTLGSTKVPITVTLESSDPKMLVYVLGKAGSSSTLFDVHIPPTPAGFVIPELPLGTLMGLASMLVALVLIRKRPMLSIRK